MKPPLVIGNWKMNGGQTDAVLLARTLRRGLKSVHGIETAIAPPFTALAAVRRVLKDGPPQLAAQNMHWEDAGAFTGEISPPMLRELGCRYALIGHSERRQLFCETDETVRKKLAAVVRTDLNPVVCVGETLDERDKGSTTEVVTRQLDFALKGLEKSVIQKIEIAYEPVWAIGTGRNATPDQVQQVHGSIREVLKNLFGSERSHETRILYGGSVRPDNARELAGVPGVNGALVGGASLKADSFLEITRCFSPCKN